MGKPRKTGNELFDIFWQEYPARINGAGAVEKRKKGPALKWFKTHNPSEESVYDMLQWLKRDKENRDKSSTAGKFYSPPCDAIVFLNQEQWMDEIGVVVTKTVRREAHRSRSVRDNNVKAAIERWAVDVLEWPIDKLRANKQFMFMINAYPEFKEWAKKQRPDRDKPKSDADLPPPQTENDRLVAQFVKKYKLF